MESANGITRQQAEDEMQLFKKVFTVVRLLDGEHLEQIHKSRRKRLRDGACQIHGHGYAGGFPWL